MPDQKYLAGAKVPPGQDDDRLAEGGDVIHHPENLLRG